MRVWAVPLLVVLAHAPARDEVCPGDRGARLAVEPGTAYVTLDDGVTRVVSLPSGTVRERRAAAAGLDAVQGLSATVGEKTYRAQGDCRKSELGAGDGEPYVTRGMIVAVAAAGTTVVALRHDGVLVIVPPRGKPRPRVVGWRQVR